MNRTSAPFVKSRAGFRCVLEPAVVILGYLAVREEITAIKPEITGFFRKRCCFLSENSLRVNESQMKKFEGQHLVDLEGVVSVALDVSLNNSLNPLRLEIGPGKTPRIQEHFSNIAGQGIPVPHAKVMKFVPAEEQAF